MNVGGLEIKIWCVILETTECEPSKWEFF